MSSSRLSARGLRGCAFGPSALISGGGVQSAAQLSGDRKGTWSLFVTRNWRITFRIDKEAIEIINLDYEDYH